MRSYYIQFKPFLIFLFKFLVCYVLLTFVYEKYLASFDQNHFEVDGFTKLVANQSKNVIRAFDSVASVSSSRVEASMNLKYKGKWVARIIEGCNAMSVMILFVSFVVAFSGTWKSTFLYILFGSLIIHVFNILRIALLSISMYNYPQYESVLHGVLFPLIIYGTVFLLWVIWVNTFSSYAKKHSKK
ncbi:exosortase family protein XrtF [Flavobacterium aciduliphilum]|uniref:Exosortase family protein XrtF n=1 Tax=Flavobacterium aciduliphilum TaxID=1101402 RepID=A0A328YC44_9FLAO|nr:exosortase family protein XrtF [Flavobacterium aciduliphilum]RAR71548.1 exosortase family protein XrtF [Flavobacterium aciduliphilum]